MRNSKMRKGLTAVIVTVFLMMMMSVNAFAATTYLVKDGTFQNAGFVNAGETVDSTIQGPGNWTQLNMGDANVDAPYLHIIIKATGDTAKAQIAVSDLFTFNLSDLGITLTEEYQDVVLPVQDNGITMLSWVNYMGLDGGTSVYTIKDMFLSDEATSSLATEEDTATVEAPTADTATADTTTADAAADPSVPKTGETNTLAIVSFISLTGCALVFVALKKDKKQFNNN